MFDFLAFLISKLGSTYPGFLLDRLLCLVLFWGPDALRRKR